LSQAGPHRILKSLIDAYRKPSFLHTLHRDGMAFPTPADIRLRKILASRLLTKSASGVPCLRRSASRRQVAALRGSTYCREYASRASSLAAALLDGLSEQPAIASQRVCEYPDLA
jgi:hypothetical protein